MAPPSAADHLVSRSVKAVGEGHLLGGQDPVKEGEAFEVRVPRSFEN